MDLREYKNLFKRNKEIIAILFLFIIIYSFNLDKYPLIWTDESWFINPAFTFVTQGFLGTTSIPNFYNIAHFTYWQPPVYFLLLAVSFKLFGFGITQARMVSVMLGFFTVLFTYLLGKELYTKKIGLIASILLISNPLFFFVSRDVRMDIAVACFTLIALYFILIALKRSKNIYYFYSGFFAMLSSLSHPDGLFSMASIALICCIYKFDVNIKHNFNLKELFYFILGPIILVMPYLYYISLNFPAFLGQFTSNITNSASGPLNNIILEFIRYGCLIYFYVNTEGWILTIIISLISIFLAFYGAFYILKNKKEIGAKFLAIVLSVHLVLFAVIVVQKYSAWYFGIILPYWSILIALLFKGRFNYKKSIQNGIMVLLIAYVVINTFGILNIFVTTGNYNPHSIQYEVPQYIPNGSVVVGDATFWLDLHDNYTYYDYRPNSSFKEPDVQYILYDDYWATHQNSTDHADIKEFLDNKCTLITEIPKNPNIKISPIKIYKVK